MPVLIPLQAMWMLQRAKGSSKEGQGKKGEFLATVYAGFLKVFLGIIWRSIRRWDIRRTTKTSNPGWERISVSRSQSSSPLTRKTLLVLIFDSFHYFYYGVASMAVFTAMFLFLPPDVWGRERAIVQPYSYFRCLFRKIFLSHWHSDIQIKLWNDRERSYIQKSNLK